MTKNSQQEKSTFDAAGYKFKGDRPLDKEIQRILGTNYIGFEVNDWGSCQYSGALDIFNALRFIDAGESPEVVLAKLGIGIKGIPVPYNPSELQVRMRRFIKETIADNKKSFEEEKDIEIGGKGY